MDMAKRVTFGVSDWAKYVEFKLKCGLPVEETFTLSMLEMEVPYERLGSETFQEFLEKHVPNIKELVKQPLDKDRSFVNVECIGDLKVGSRVIWFGSDSTTFKGTVKWLGSIERILCAGVFTDEKVGSPFPIVWRNRRIFYTPSGHSLILRVSELILKSDYAQRQSLLSRTLSKLMRKVSIRERPRERNVEETGIDPQKLKQFDVIYPFAVDSGPSGLKVGDKIIWSKEGTNYTGQVKWLGHLSCQSGLTVGIEFKKAVGNSSGTFEGHKLFECKPNFGKFLCVSCVKKHEWSSKTEIPAENGLMSTTTFDFTNQDLANHWQRQQTAPRNFEVGDTVLYQRDSSSYYTGRVKWLGSSAGSNSQMAGIQFDTPLKSGSRHYPDPLPSDCPPEVTDIVPLDTLVTYTRIVPEGEESPPTAPSPLSQIHALASRRLSNRTRTHNPTARASHEWFPQKGVIAPSISTEKLKRLIGYKRGIQGRSNSSHMDALLFAIFSCSDSFDKMLLQTQDADPLTVQIYKEILRTEVANRLRRKYYCPASNIQAVAQVFSCAQHSILPGKSDQILETLLQKVDETEAPNPIISYSNGTKSYLHRIMSSTSNFSENVISVQNLLEADLNLQNTKFENLPVPALVVVLPDRTDGSAAPSKLFIPNPSISFSNLVTLNAPSPESSSSCALCGGNSSMECADCADLVVSDPSSSDSSTNAFCNQCFEAFHQHWTRRNHNRKLPDAEKKKLVYELQSIICTRDNQSIAFVKCGTTNGEWIVHDSACDGPQVQNVFSLGDCLNSLESDPCSVQRDWESFIPEIKIILAHAHMCIYAPSPGDND